LSATYDRAAELLSRSGNPEHKDRLLAVSRRVLFHVGSLPAPPTWKGFNLYKAVRRYEARIVERALKDAGGIVVRAAELLGIGRQSLNSMLKGKGRHAALARLSLECSQKSAGARYTGRFFDLRTDEMAYSPVNRCRLP
jgi:hypothetical protein